MRQVFLGMIAAVAAMVAGASPAAACGYGSCSPCAGAFVSPCAPAYVPVPAYTYSYSGCGACSGWGHYERLADPIAQYHRAVPAPQYYYVNQGPTYTGPGAFAPYPYYQEAGVEGPAVYGHRWHHHHYRRHHYGPYYEGRRVLHSYY